MIVIGHRGARGEAPENTLPAFLHALAAGVRHFELDVRLAYDGRPVVIHDESVDRTTDETGAVACFPAAHLASLDARRNTAGWHGFTGIPTLEEVLVACTAAASWQLEIKSDKPARIKVLIHAMAELLVSLRMTDRVTLTSLDINVLKIAQKEAPGITRGYVAEQVEPAPLATAKKLGCALLVANWRITDEALVQAAHAACIPVSVWTVNDLLVAERMFNIGVDSLITDFPTAMLAHTAMRSRIASLRENQR
ncbi:MAG: glycerophosphodiester phosphodiesterase [Pseudomonadota bacterium]